MVLVERAGNFGLDAIVVPVQPFANVAGEGDEVACAKDEILFAQADVILVSHDWGHF